MKKYYIPIPIARRVDDKTINIIDGRNGKLIETKTLPVHTITGEVLKIFIPYKVKLLKKIHDHKKGTEMEVEVTPMGVIYLMYDFEIEKTDVKIGIDFKFI
jgi:hypothetical protein